MSPTPTICMADTKVRLISGLHSHGRLTTERSVDARCSMALLTEGRICDEPAVGVYVGIGGRQLVCARHRDQLKRRWGIDIRPLEKEET